MKVSVNLATLSSSRERYGLAWAAPLALFAAIGLVLLSYSAVHGYLEYHKIQNTLGDLIRQDQALRDRETALQKDLDQPQEQVVFKKARFVNGLIERRRLTLTAIMEKVSKLLPPTVRLNSMGLAHSKNDLTVRFSVEGTSVDGLESFLGRVEDSPDFNDFAVSSQGFQPVGSTPGLMGIVCTVRYVGQGASEAVEKP